MRRCIFLLLGFLILMPLVSAEILFSQPERIYNIGDPFVLDVTLKPSSTTNDFLKLSVSCGGENAEIYRNPFNLNSGEERAVNVNAVLSPNLINGLRGQCSLLAEYGSESSNSQDFEISDLIEVELFLEEKRFDPDAKVELEGAAVKKSGGAVDGFIEIRVDSLGISTSRPFSNGEFSTNFTIPKDAKSGEHEIKIRVYETEGSGTVSNEGNASEIIIISQVLNEIIIEIDSQNILPESGLKYKVSAFDQAGDVIDEDVRLVIYEPGDFVFLEKVIRSGTEETLELEKTSVPGYWKIEAIIGDLSAKKLFYVEEIEEIQTSLINDTLIVTNTGNVQYDGPIEIYIGTSREVRQIVLEVGETKRFKLVAPDGTYLIRVVDGEEDVTLGNVLLTGKAIGVEDVRNGFSASFSQPIIWFLVVVVLFAAIAYIRTKKVFKNGKSKPTTTNLIKETRAASPEVGYGKKEEASVIALKTLSKETPYATAAIQKALVTAKDAGAKIYVDDDYKVIIFAPSLTKVKDNESLAVKVAKRMTEVFHDHNKLYKDKINFGVGVNRGEIISETKNREFKFTTTGGVISKAKRIAQGLDGEALLSDSIYRVVSGTIKTEKLQDKEAWRITRIIDRSKHDDFLHKFINKK